MEKENFGYNLSAGISLSFPNDHTIFKKEILIYDSVSLFSELGGALGVLIGVSLLSVCDLLRLTYNILKK